LICYPGKDNSTTQVKLNPLDGRRPTKRFPEADTIERSVEVPPTPILFRLSISKIEI
jgi:hypothetical protein